MATNYPTSVDTPTDPTGSNTMDGVTGGAGVVHATQHTNANDGLVAVQTAVGTTAARVKQNAMVIDTVVTAATANIAADHFTPCDTTSNSIVLTLPNAPVDKTQCAAKMVTLVGTNTVTVNCAGSDVFNVAGGVTTSVLSLKGQGQIYQYTHATGIWTVAADDLGLSQLDLRYAKLASPTFTGVPAAPTAAAATNTTQIATTAMVQSAIAQDLPLTGDVTTIGAAATLVGTANVESIIRANTLNQLATATGAYSMGTNRLRSVQAGILSTDTPNLAQLAGSQRAYVLSGCVWTADAAGSTLNGSMTAGVVMIAGISLTVAAVTAHAFTASRDTYIDLADNGDGTANITYTGVVNNTISPALANSGTLFNTIRVAVVFSGASFLPSTFNVCQGLPSFVTVTAQGSSTVAAGSNGAAYNATPLNVAAGANFAAGGGWAQIAHAGVGTSTISYTSVSSNTLVGVVGIAGGGTLSTGDTVTQVTPINVCDMLGNPIFPTRPYPVTIGSAQFTNTLASTVTPAAVPVQGLIAPFIVPAGPARLVKMTLITPYLASSATAGTTLGTTTFANTTGVGQTQTKVAVASDGAPITSVGYIQLAAGSYNANVTMSQGAAGTITMGITYAVNFLLVELV